MAKQKSNTTQSTFKYRTPAGIQDFAGQPNLQAALLDLWNKNLDGFNQQGMAGNVWNATNTPPLTNYFNPVQQMPSGAFIASNPINWLAFPGRLAYNFPSLTQDQLNQLADTGAMPNQISNSPCDTASGHNVAYYPYGPRGWQDEYCEWSVTRNADGKITRVDFTCENPEYWNSLWKIDRNTVLALYQSILNNNTIAMSDLELPNTLDPSTGLPCYNPLNKWNTGTASTATGGGAVHLTSTPNTLQTEIGISSAATVLRNNPSGTTGNTVWANPRQNNALLCDAQYGQKFRNSDPSIGAGINGLVNTSTTISLTDPPGLYIQMPDFSNYVTPDGTSASSFWTIVRGSKSLSSQGGQTLPGNFILHAVFEVPSSKPYIVNDITIEGEQINWGSQIAATFQMQVMADSYGQTPLPQGYNAVGSPSPQNTFAQPQQLFFEDYYTQMYNNMVPNPVNNPISELSNSTFIAPNVLPLGIPYNMVLTAATVDTTNGLPSVTFDDVNIRASVNKVVPSIFYAVPGNSQPSSCSSLYLTVQANAGAALGLHGLYVTNAGQAQSAIMPALLNVANSITRTVQSTIAWQDTGLNINAETPAVSIAYYSGAWTDNPNDNGGQLYDANGNPQFIAAKPGYTLPGANEGAMIGKVGSTVFLIGNGAAVPSGLTGELYLCINDDLTGEYGPGLADNIGSITMLITLNN